MKVGDIVIYVPVKDFKVRVSEVKDHTFSGTVVWSEYSGYPVGKYAGDWIKHVFKPVSGQLQLF